jgi:hypothetical protein
MDIYSVKLIKLFRQQVKVLILTAICLIIVRVGHNLPNYISNLKSDDFLVMISYLGSTILISWMLIASFLIPLIHGIYSLIRIAITYIKEKKDQSQTVDKVVFQKYLLRTTILVLVEFSIFLLLQTLPPITIQ